MGLDSSDTNSKYIDGTFNPLTCSYGMYVKDGGYLSLTGLVARSIALSYQIVQTLMRCRMLRHLILVYTVCKKGAQWISGRVPRRRHCVNVIEQDTFILA